MKATTLTAVFRIFSLSVVPLSVNTIQDAAAYGDDPPVVYRALLEQTDAVPETAASAETPELPAPLVIAPGRYAFAGKAYDLQKQGLYRFFLPVRETQQRIVYDANNGDVEAFLSALAWIVSHGCSDVSKSDEALTQKATTTKLFVDCGRLSQWAVYVLAANKIRARRVGSCTLDEPNSYDNGHGMIEVYQEDLKRWILYDLDNNACFFHGKAPLSLVEMVDSAQSGDYQIKRLAADTPLDVSNYKENGFDWAFNEEYVNTKTGLPRWYKRVLQVAVIDNCSYICPERAGERARREKPGSSQSSVLDRIAFLKKFY
jgi:hypothetical protein